MNNYLPWIESEIKKQKFGRQPKSLYDPLHYIMSLGGKRLRPMLTLLSYSLFRDDVKKIVPQALAVEVFHNFTLMHDDIMDQAPLRRGEPTVHEKWNVSTAILSGDVMQVKVYEIISALEASLFKEVALAFNKCAIEVCEGQQWDMEFEGRSKVSEKEYIEMIRLKTAVLLGFSLELGAILAGASKENRKALREFGVNIGIGFQLKDDLLDVYADQKKFGKQVGGDIIANKKTFLLIKALEKATGKDKRELETWINAKKFNKRNKVKAVTALYDSLVINSITERKINAFFEAGFKALKKVDAPENRLRSLRSFTVDLMRRQQ